MLRSSFNSPAPGVTISIIKSIVLECGDQLLNASNRRRAKTTEVRGPGILATIEVNTKTDSNALKAAVNSGSILVLGDTGVLDGSVAPAVLKPPCSVADITLSATNFDLPQISNGFQGQSMTQAAPQELAYARLEMQELVDTFLVGTSAQYTPYCVRMIQWDPSVVVAEIMVIGTVTAELKAVIEETMTAASDDSLIGVSLRGNYVLAKETTGFGYARVISTEGENYLLVSLLWGLVLLGAVGIVPACRRRERKRLEGIAVLHEVARPRTDSELLAQLDAEDGYLKLEGKRVAEVGSDQAFSFAPEAYKGGWADTGTPEESFPTIESAEVRRQKEEADAKTELLLQLLAMEKEAAEADKVMAASSATYFADAAKIFDSDARTQTTDDNSRILADGRKMRFDGTLTDAFNNPICHIRIGKGVEVYKSGGTIVLNDGTQILSTGGMVLTDGSKVMTTAVATAAAAAIGMAFKLIDEHPGSSILGSGTRLLADGRNVNPDGTIQTMTGHTIGHVNQGGGICIILGDGTFVYEDGTQMLPDGTRVSKNGIKQSPLMDGVFVNVNRELPKERSDSAALEALLTKTSDTSDAPNGRVAARMMVSQVFSESSSNEPVNSRAAVHKMSSAWQKKALDEEAQVLSLAEQAKQDAEEAWGGNIEKKVEKPLITISAKDLTEEQLSLSKQPLNQKQRMKARENMRDVLDPKEPTVSGPGHKRAVVQQLGTKWAKKAGT